MVAWRLVMTLMGLVQNYHGLLAARLFLRVVEAGLYPGVVCKCRRVLQVLFRGEVGAPRAFRMSGPGQCE